MVELEALLAGINGNGDGSDSSNGLLQLLLIALGHIDKSNIPGSLLGGVIVALIVHALVGVARLGVNT